jgi:hypothetical protein
MAVKTAKRVIIDYGSNKELANGLEYLQKYYIGMNKAEIFKIALAELFQKKVRQMKIVDLTREEEKGLAEAVTNSEGFVEIPENLSFSDFLEKNDF